MSDSNPTFYRSPHDGEHLYSIVIKSLIRDESISPECRWLLIYLLSNRDGWRIQANQIINHVKGSWGRDKVYKVINEGIEAGYILREEIIVDNMKRITYAISETPRFKKCFRRPDFQDADFQDPENTDIKNTIDKKEHIQEREDPSSTASPKENSKIAVAPAQMAKSKRKPRVGADLIQFGAFVKLGQVDYDDYVKRLGKEFTDNYIERINKYCAQSKPEGYKDYKAAMDNWLSREKNPVPNNSAVGVANVPMDQMQMNLKICRIVKNAVKEEGVAGVFFEVVGQNKASITHTGKDIIRREMPLTTITPQKLRSWFLNQFDSICPRVAERLRGEKKTSENPLTNILNKVMQAQPVASK